MDKTVHLPTPHTYPFHVGAKPFLIDARTHTFFEQLGHHLLLFYQAANQLYADSASSRQPQWIAEYLDIGKPESVIEYGRMNRFRKALPGIIRPDLILTEEGMIATELDSVPGGIGLTLEMSQSFTDESLIGGIHGMRDGFARMIRSLTMKDNPNLCPVTIYPEPVFRK